MTDERGSAERRMACANCGQAIYESAPGRWWHVETMHAWCRYRYDTGSRGAPPMPYPIPGDQRATPQSDRDVP